MAHGPPFGLDEVLVSSRVIVAASLTLLAMLVGCGQDEARVSATLDPQLTSSQPGDEIAASADSTPQSPPTPPNDPPR